MTPAAESTPAPATEIPRSRSQGTQKFMRMTVTVRQAVEADVETLFDIRTSVRENLQNREELAQLGVTPESVAELLRGNGRAWLALVNGEPAGFSLANADEGTVFAMFIRPEHEGKGLGRRLMAEAEGWLFSRGWPEIWLLTGVDPSLRAHGFYRRLGWRLSGPHADQQVRYVKSAGEANRSDP